jgi:NDP-sugar pyrophosphorylase family protein
MEGAMLRGPLSIGKDAVVKMGAAIYGATTIGPACVVGGEIRNSIITGYSNKAHDGYLGDAWIGEWCNLGAGTSCSNLRNTATPVNVWHMHSKQFVKGGLKCGLVMGDHSKCSINTSFNTATVFCVCAKAMLKGAKAKQLVRSTKPNLRALENEFIE